MVAFELYLRKRISVWKFWWFGSWKLLSPPQCALREAHKSYKCKKMLVVEFFSSSSIRFPHFKLRRSQISPEMCWNCRQTVFMSHHLHFLLKLPLLLETLNEYCCTFKRKKKIWWKHPKDLWLVDDHMLWLLEFQTELKITQSYQYSKPDIDTQKRCHNNGRKSCTTLGTKLTSSCHQASC